MPNLGLIFLAFVATFAGVWYVSLPEPIRVLSAQMGYAVELKAHWAISAKEAELQAAVGQEKALRRTDDTYGGAEKLYQTRQVIRQRSLDCLTGRATPQGFDVSDKASCTDRRGDDINPYRRPFAFYKDGTHFSPPAGEKFTAPKQSPTSGSPLLQTLDRAIPRLRALDVKLSTGPSRDQAATWSITLHGSDWTEVETAERKQQADGAPVTQVALLSEPTTDVEGDATRPAVCRTFREAARTRGEVNVPDSTIRFGRVCRTTNDSGQQLLVVSYHKSRQRIRSDDAPAQCASVVRNIVQLEVREGKPAPALAACIGARFHEHDALDVDVNLYETAANGQLRHFSRQ